MQQDLTTGFYTISVLEGGKGALDPASTATMEQVRQIETEKERETERERDWLPHGLICRSRFDESSICRRLVYTFSEKISANSKPWMTRNAANISGNWQS